MSIESFLEALRALDAHPPTLAYDAARADAFLQMGRFFEQNLRPGQAFDLARWPNPAWEAVERRLDQALQQIAAEEGADDATLWQLYNDGVVVTTTGRAIGFDVVPYPRRFGWPDTLEFTEKLARQLDLLLVTHAHPDHYDRALVGEMLRRGRPVVLPESVAYEWPPEATVLVAREGADYVTDDVGILCRRGWHVWEKDPATVPLCYYEVVLPDEITLIFIGDHDYTRGLTKTPGRKLDVFFIPWRNPNETYEPGHPAYRGDTLDAVRRVVDILQPRLLLYEHVAEWEHVYDGFTAAYDLALRLQKNLPIPSELLFWGEHVRLPRLA